MNIRLIFIAVIISFGLTGNAWAQSITIPTTAVIKGNTGTVNLAFTAGNAATNLDFAISYDETVVDEAAAAISCSPTIPQLGLLNCSVDQVNNLIKGIGVNFTANPLASTNPFAVLTLPVLPGAATGDSVQAFVANFFDVNGTSTGTQNGTWTLTVTDGPQPDWSSVPSSAAGINLGSHTTDTGSYTTNLVVTNAGAAGSTLTGSCSLDPIPMGSNTPAGGTSAVFGIVGDGTLGAGLAQNASANITIECDTTGAPVMLHTGTLSCTHNGDGTTETSVTQYPLSCNITATPEPAFLGVDNGLTTMSVAEEGDANATATLTVSNNGDTGTTLTGSCVYAGDSQIMVSGGLFSVTQGAPGVNVLATCSGAAEGAYSGSLTCGPTTGQTWVAANSPYAVSCTVGPPGDAVYSSVPAPGAIINMTPAGPVPEGSVIPDKNLVITNAAPEANDRDLVLLECGLASNQPVGAAPLGVGAISATIPNSPLAPFASTTVIFSCDSEFAGDYSDIYSCTYDTDGDGELNGRVNYTVNCGVRLPESDVTVTPASGSSLTIYAPAGGSGTTSVTFREILAEGENATLETCYVDDTTYFSVVQPFSFPQDIPADGSIQVVVEGMGTEAGDPTSTTLHCMYTDSNDDSTEVTWAIDVVTLVVAIPTLSTWGLMLMILTLLGLGGLVMRRRNLS